jgi:hypothetical protein
MIPSIPSPASRERDRVRAQHAARTNLLTLTLSRFMAVGL